MPKTPDSIAEFLRQRRLAVLGVSRDTRQPANAIYRKLRTAGYEVYAVNPQTDTVEGDRCYPSLETLPVRVDGAVAVTRPDVSDQVVMDCARLGIPRVWMHRSFGDGSVSERALRLAAERGVLAIAGGCPMMYVAPVDPAHRGMCWILGLFGKLPRT
jgi:predicted CoA-binding protein